MEVACLENFKLAKGYKGIFESLPEEKKKELMDKKADFAKKAGIEL